MKKKSTTTTVTFESGFIQHLIAKVSNDNLAEAIMASGADLGIILKGAFDYKSLPQFDYGEFAFCNTMIYDYHSEQSRLNNNSEYREIGECRIMDFNPYNNTYTISYTVFMQDGTTKTNTRAVEACSLSTVGFEMH
jgi:hypothetical protein